MRVLLLFLLLPSPVFAQFEMKPPRLPKPTNFPEIVVSRERASELVKGGMVQIAAGCLRVDGACVAMGISCVQEALGRAGLSGSQGVLLVGEGPEVGRAFWLLEWAGIRNVRIVEGGRIKERSPQAKTFQAEPRESAVADAAWVRERLGVKGTEILDVRDPGIWMENEYQAPPRWAQGHVPHALPFDFRRWLPKADGRWPKPGAPWETLERLGPRLLERDRLDPNAEIVLYGEGPDDPLPGLGYLTLRRMGRPARVFPGGFEAWSADPSSPVVRIAGPLDVARLLGIDDPRTRADAMVVDLREPGDYSRLGHLPGAVSHPAYDQEESLEAFMAERWPVEKSSRRPIILYCYGRECIRSRNTATLLARMGYTNLVWFREGMISWIEAGLPVVE
jgi:3-mercaptopyruvate sulfurtransferase SseA